MVLWSPEGSLLSSSALCHQTQVPFVNSDYKMSSSDFIMCELSLSCGFTQLQAYKIFLIIVSPFEHNLSQEACGAWNLNHVGQMYISH